jgi:hypothetical protein
MVLGSRDGQIFSTIVPGTERKNAIFPALEVPGYFQAAPTGREDDICQGYGSLRLSGPMFRFVFEPHGNLFGCVACS